MVFRRTALQSISVLKLQFKPGGFYLEVGMPPKEFRIARQINLSSLMRNADGNCVEFFAVPTSSFSLISGRDAGTTKMTYFKNLIQVNVKNQSIIYNLDHATA